MYSFMVLVLVATFLSGIKWYHSKFIYFFYYTQISILVICGVGFLFYGRAIWMVLKQSGNVSPNKSTLPLRLVVFILCYLVEVYTGNVLNQAGALGLVFGTLFNVLMNGIAFLGIFLILFFQPAKRIKRPVYSPSSSPASTSTSTGNLTIQMIQL